MKPFKIFSFFRKSKKIVIDSRLEYRKDVYFNGDAYTPENCVLHGHHRGYNQVLDIYKEHGFIPDKNLTVVKLNHWTAYIKLGIVNGYNEAVEALTEYEAENFKFDPNLRLSFIYYKNKSI